LLKAREISLAIEKMYDALQLAHGSLLIRAANPQLYLSLGNTYMNLGDYRDAVDALRFAKGINPRTPEVYDGLNVAYSAMDNPSLAAVNMEEKALVDNFQPATMGAIRDVYQKIPDGACAFTESGGRSQPNLQGCPRMKNDVCAAFAELSSDYREARMPQDAEQARTAAIQRYGCPAK